MITRRIVVAVVCALALTGVLWSESVPGWPNDLRRADPHVAGGINRNSLLLHHKGKVKISASSVYGGWPIENLLDGKETPAWFSASNDSAARGQAPWVQVEFPEAVNLRRFTVIGCRDVSYPQGYFVLAGTLEVRDTDGRVIYQATQTGVGKSRDFDFVLERPLTRVMSVRFTSLADQGDVNGSGDVALSEVLAD